MTGQHVTAAARSTAAPQFPLPFRQRRVLCGGTGRADGRFLVTAMLTESYMPHAERLIASCVRLGLPYALYVVPAVHKSISPAGAADLAFTKANLIRHALDVHRKPVLYLDVDFVFFEYPEKIDALVRDGYDFAIYNWLADEHTAAYVPVDAGRLAAVGLAALRGRLYRYSHAVELYTTEQLVCSGGVQFYNDTPAARNLLCLWQRNIGAFPDSADDHSLDFTFNNERADIPDLRVAWLDKAYARLPYWIYVRPVISHADFPRFGAVVFREIRDPAGRQRFYPDRARLLDVEPCFPSDCVIDTREKLLLRPEGGRLVPVRRLTETLWL